jgi:hypothetical protein
MESSLKKQSINKKNLGILHENKHESISKRESVKRLDQNRILTIKSTRSKLFAAGTSVALDRKALIKNTPREEGIGSSAHLKDAVFLNVAAFPPLRPAQA